MQSAFSMAPARIWHSARAQYVLLACGLALAASAVFAGNTLDGRYAAQFERSRLGVSASVVHSPSNSASVTFYIVGSDRGANELAKLVWEDHLAVIQTRGSEICSLVEARFLVIDSSEKAALLGEMVRELMAIERDTGFTIATVIDLRPAA